MTQTQWRSATEWPLVVAAGAFLVAYALQVIAQPQGGALLVTEIVMWATWALFAVDYAANLVLASHRKRWFLRHFHELLIVLLPLLRPLRLLRLVSVLTVFDRAEGVFLRGRVVIYAVGSSVLLVIVAALAMLDVEQDVPGASITTIGDALWWAVVTITTVGYGDVAPVSAPGRLIAVAVMIAGIALLGTITASIASWLVSRVASAQAGGQAEAQSDIDALAREIAELRAVVAAERGTPET